MKVVLFILVLPILFIPLPGMTDGLFTALWAEAPGYMTLACVLTALVYYFFKFNSVVVRIDMLEKDVKALDKKMNEGFERIEKRMDKMDARFERLEDKISSILEVLALRKG
ncbi:MAG TPA: hypothetical protein VFE50_19265 [Cyclobacteriaceae bacterium]|nr:hypothetical protein [Cyclobacteriaceae bacterium]